MEKEEKKLKSRRTPQDAPISIRLTKDEREAFRSIAQANGKPVSTMIRECCLAYLQNAGEHERLMASLVPEDPKEIQKTFFDTLNQNNDAMITLMNQFGGETIKNQKEIDLLLRRVLYIVFYYSNVQFGGPDHDNRAKFARERLAKFFGWTGLDKELYEDKN